MRRSIQSCLASVRGKADLRFYTSAMAAGDVAQVLTALGYDQVNLFGGSYGASAAQIFQQMFPARVRTMTLLGGTLLGIPLFERFPQASQQALDQVLARCASDPACHDAFPRLDTEWIKLRASLARSPVIVPAALSPAGTAIRLDDALLAAGVHQLLLSADTATYVPLVIHSLYAANSQPAATAAVIRRLTADGLLDISGSQSVIAYPIRCAEALGTLPARADLGRVKLLLPGHHPRRAVVAVRLHPHTRARRRRRLRAAAAITGAGTDDQRNRRPARPAREHVRSAEDLAQQPPAGRTRPIPHHE